MARMMGNTVLLTGAGRGIGRAGAVALAAEQARVAVVDIDEACVQDTASYLQSKGYEAIGLRADVSSEEDMRNVVDEVVAWSGQIDVVVHSAGIVRPAMLKDMSLADFEEVVRVNLTGTFVTLQAVLEHWIERGSGRFIALTSPAAERGQIGGGNYAAAKAGVAALVKTAASELARHGITVNALMPIAATDMSATVRNDPKLEERFLKMIPLRRWAEPEEIAHSLVFLASPESAYMTGATLTIDGGRTI